MRYGQATSAITRTAGRPPMAMTKVGYTAPAAPAAPPAAMTRTGQAQIVTGQGSTTNTSSIIFMGADLPVNIVPIAAAGPPLVPGTLPVRFTPCEPVVLVDWEISDPSGKLLITDIRTCRSVIFEGGFFAVSAMQSASTSRPQVTRALQRLILMQTVPLIITFANPVTVGNGFDVQAALFVVPIPLSQALPAEVEAALARYNTCASA